MIRVLAVVLLLSGCVSKNELAVDDTSLIRSVEYQTEIDQLLSIDKKNKLLEEEYLREIAIAQINDDRDAYKFYIVEYIKVPRIPVPEWVTQEPDFYPRKTAQQIIRETHNNTK